MRTLQEQHQYFIEKGRPICVNRGIIKGIRQKEKADKATPLTIEYEQGEGL